ncbi:MAG: DUF2029 domain-containing protein [Chloroflexi bacterium]|nr:DUF2029 domain-containing protein [Chloroflexota bacterium]
MTLKAHTAAPAAGAGQSSSRPGLLGYALFGVALFLLVLAFALLPLPGGDDWETFYGAARRVLDGVPLYGTRITFSYFYNMPWLAVLFAPLALLPFRWGWAFLSTASILIVFLLCKRWNLGAVKLVAILCSPPMLYTLLHGNIDALVLGAVLLPREFWLLAAMTKPQTAVALALGVLRANWWRTGLLTAGVLLLSLAWFGNWLPAYLAQPVDLIDKGHNVFRYLFPYQVIPGLLLAWIGWKRQDEKFWIGASPFFSPYAATSTLLGPLMLLLSQLKDWQAVAVVALYWVVSVVLSGG